MDAYGHVNNVAVGRLIEEARIRALWRSDDGSPDLPTAVLDASPGTPVHTLVARLETEYLAPMPYTREPIDIEMWLGRLGGASVEICFELYSPPGVGPRILYARSSTTVVTVLAETGRPIRIPITAREAWADYVESPMGFTRR